MNYNHLHLFEIKLIHGLNHMKCNGRLLKPNASHYSSIIIYGKKSIDGELFCLGAFNKIGIDNCIVNTVNNTILGHVDNVILYADLDDVAPLLE